MARSFRAPLRNRYKIRVHIGERGGNPRRKLTTDIRANRTSQNYLIEHSAGSGKTNTIAWLTHILASLHDAPST
ncbi:MAG: hypothetical protein LBN00_04355 [Oscillospiraceae bacterium]|jgi:type I site-specific restriction-modification system R (restriction) subunit|nr:hypothetical protein [Oscillospiraceae bacterium]